MDRKEAMQENNRRREAEREVFDGLCLDMAPLPLRKIKIYNPDDKNSCKNDEIVAGNQYLIIENGRPSLGYAIKSWFGWQFMADGYLHQLNLVDMVFEIEFPEFPSKPLGRVDVPEDTSEDAEEEDEY